MEVRALKAYVQLQKDHKDPFNSQQARMFTFDSSQTIWVVSSHVDVYEALEQIQDLSNPNPKLQTMTHLGIETCGWAAPVDETGDNDDTPPSEHPARRRCRLIAVVDRNLEVASALGFQNEPLNKIITDNGSARGALNDAVKEAMAGIIIQQVS